MQAAPAVAAPIDQLPMIIYIVYLGSFVFAPASLVGVIMAYVNRGGATPWARTHYQFQIRTFWIGLLYGVISLICAFILIGFIMLLLVAIWTIVRCVMGIKYASKGEPYPKVQTWWW